MFSCVKLIVKEIALHSETRNNYAIIGWLICGLGAIFYSYEYLLRIAPSVMEEALRAHFDLSATGFGLVSSTYALLR